MLRESFKNVLQIFKISFALENDVSEAAQRDRIIQ